MHDWELYAALESQGILSGLESKAPSLWRRFAGLGTPEELHVCLHEAKDLYWSGDLALTQEQFARLAMRIALCAG